MKVGVSINTLNTADWERVNAEDWSRPPVRSDWEAFRGTLSLGELVEPLGFDSLWVSEHFGSPYGMVPNTLQMLAYWAGRTERIDLGSIVENWRYLARMAAPAQCAAVVKADAYGCGLEPVAFDRLGDRRGLSARDHETVEVREAESADPSFTLTVTNRAVASGVLEDSEKAVSALTRANVTIYAIDPRGMLDAERISDSRLSSEAQASFRRAQDSLRVLAAETGGFAAVNQNDLSTVFAHQVRPVHAGAGPFGEPTGDFHHVADFEDFERHV